MGVIPGVLVEVGGIGNGVGVVDPMLTPLVDPGLGLVGLPPPLDEGLLPPPPSCLLSSCELADDVLLPSVMLSCLITRIGSFYSWSLIMQWDLVLPLWLQWLWVNLSSLKCTCDQLELPLWLPWH